jgi:hypothetical protein
MLDVIEPWLLQNCTSLQYLDISKVNLESLPLNISELPSLESLHLYDSDQLRSLPNLPSSLQRLYIPKCHPELRKKATECGSLEWNKISHIPDVEIGRPTLVIQLHAYELLSITDPFFFFLPWLKFGIMFLTCCKSTVGDCCFRKGVQYNRPDYSGVTPIEVQVLQFDVYVL